MTRFLLPLIAAALFLSFFRLGAVTLFDVDEAVFSEATKEMVQSGDWMTPTYNGVNRYDKPILFYWLMAIPYKLFGINEFSARFPSALAAFLLSLSTFLFAAYAPSVTGKTQEGPDWQRGLYASLPLTLSLYFLVYSHAAVVDMTLTLFISLSLFSFYIFVARNAAGSGKANIYIALFYAFSALAFLTKGLIGIMFPFGIALVYMVITEGWRGAGKVFSLKGALLFLLISAPWYLAQFSINGGEFIDQFFIKHHFKRFTEVNSGHGGAFYYYVPVLICGLFPWIAFLPSGIRESWSRTNTLGLFGLIWFFAIFVFFSLSTTKLPNYILPSVPAASVLISHGMLSLDKKRVRYAHVFITVVALLACVALIVASGRLTKLYPGDTGWLPAAAGIMLAMAMVSGYVLATKKNAHFYTSAAMVLFLLLLSVKAMPFVNSALQGTLHSYSLYAKERLGPNDRVIAYNLNQPSIVFYSDRKVAQIDDRNSLFSHVEAIKHAVAIAKTKDKEVLENAGFVVIRDDGKYVLLEKN